MMRTSPVDMHRTIEVRDVPIDWFGVEEVKLPSTVSDVDGMVAHTVVDLCFFQPVYLRQRAVEYTDAHQFLVSRLRMIDLADLEAIHAELATLGVNKYSIKMGFAWFIQKFAPVSKVSSKLDIDVEVQIESSGGDPLQVRQAVTVPITLLTPSSKAGASRAAQNQRSYITFGYRPDPDQPISMMVELVESQASCEIYGLLKRPDEKYVTEKAYDNPKFVEDYCRDLYLAAKSRNMDGEFEIYVNGQQSTVNHSLSARKASFTR